MVVIIKMKGLPWEASARDIRNFYRGLDISEEDIHLAPNPEGKASGYAFACFQKDDEARKAMHRNGKFVGKRYIELILSSQTEMDKILKEGVRMRRDDLVDKKNANNDTNEKKLNSSRENGKTTRGTSRRSRSRSPVRLSRSADGFKVRRDQNNANLGNYNGVRSAGSRVDELSIKEDVYRRERERERNRGLESRSGLKKNSARGRDGRGSGRSSVGRREAESRMRYDASTNRNGREPTSPDGTYGNSTWAILTGLPYTVTKDEILEFFKGLDVLNVHFMRHSSGNWAGKKNGTAYVEFKSVGDCIQGADRNHQYIRKRFIGVRRCRLDDVLTALEARGNDNWLLEKTNAKGGSFDQESEMYSLGNTNGNNGNDSYSDVGMNVNGIGANSPGAIPSPTNAELGMDGSMTPIKQLAAGANISVNDISARCVIGIRNLPSTVSAEEILDFFYGFPIIPDSIRIHYLAPGRSSGDAMVTLPTSGEAYSAIKQLNNKPVGKRKAQLFLV